MPWLYFVHGTLHSLGSNAMTRNLLLLRTHYSNFQSSSHNSRRKELASHADMEAARRAGDMVAGFRTGLSLHAFCCVNWTQLRRLTTEASAPQRTGAPAATVFAVAAADGHAGAC